MTAPLASSRTGKPELRLLMQSLNDTDIARVSAFLSIGRDRLQYDWQVVAAGEVHVLMLGAAEPSTVLGIVDSPIATLRVTDARAGAQEAPDTLVRPLQYEALVDALCAVEHKLSGRPAAASPAAQPAQGALAAALSPGDRFRLRRWPPTAMLQGGRYHQRLASFLSARHLDLEELARLSNVAPAQCEAFLAALIAAGLLDVKPAEEPAPLAAAAAPRGSPPLRPPTSDTGLFGRIRRSLGIVWPKK